MSSAPIGPAVRVVRRTVLAAAALFVLGADTATPATHRSRRPAAGRTGTDRGVPVPYPGPARYPASGLYPGG